MKLLAVGDIHYNLKQFDWLLAVAPKYDALIIAGDLLDIASYLDLDSQIIVVEKYLDRLSKLAQLIVCSGNHDGDTKNSDNEFVANWLSCPKNRTIVGDYNSITIGDWHFSVCPWWDGPTTRQAVKVFLEAEASKVQSKWFVIHHAPPSNSPISWTGKRDLGDTDLRDFILDHKPNIVLSGHIHNAPFRNGGCWYDHIGKTWAFNGGRQIGELPAYLAFDLDADLVQWESLAGSESLDLSRGDSSVID